MIIAPENGSWMSQSVTTSPLLSRVGMMGTNTFRALRFEKGGQTAASWQRQPLQGGILAQLDLHPIRPPTRMCCFRLAGLLNDGWRELG
jgi:hypothetical protein